MLYGELPEVTLTNGEKAKGFTFKIPSPAKSAVLRLPTNQEMLDRLNKHKSIRRTIGRRQSQTESVPNLKADLDLFNAIRLEGPDFDEFEAAVALGKITSNEVTDCERVGDQYRVTLKTAFGITTHTLNIPSQRDITVYRRSVVSSIDLPHNCEEIRFRTEPAVALYNAVVTDFTGYAESYKPEDVPPHHKSSVVIELIQAIEELDSSLDPNS